MALNTFPSLPLPDLPITVEPQFQTVETSFGDGYRVVAQAGINARADRVSLTWTNIDATEHATLMTFLNAHAPATPFRYTAPDGIQRTYICRQFTDTQIEGTEFFKVAATFEQYHGV